MKKLFCTQAQHKIISDIIAQSFFEVLAFGSRVTGTAQPTSDLDLGYYGPQKFSTTDAIEQAFEESDLPFKVDLIDLNAVSQNFLTHIKDDLTPIKQLLADDYDDNDECHTHHQQARQERR